MTRHTSKDQLLQDIQVQHRLLMRTLAALGEEVMLQPGAVGNWSVKDVLAHLTAWERLFLDWYYSGLRGYTPQISPVGMSRIAMNALNQQIFAKNQNQTLEDVLAEFQASYQQTLAVIETISEEDMFTRDRFAWTGRLTLADYIAGNTCSHYAWASAKIRKWVKYYFSA